MFLYIHAVWFGLMLVSASEGDFMSFLRKFDRDTARQLMTLPLLLVVGVYPLILSISSFVVLMCNLMSGRDYEMMYSWHRNSFLKLMTNIIFSTCLISWLSRVHIDSVYSSKNMTPLVVMAVCVISMVILTRHKNSVAWFLISVLILCQFVVMLSAESDVEL